MEAGGRNAVPPRSSVLDAWAGAGPSPAVNHDEGQSAEEHEGSHGRGWVDFRSMSGPRAAPPAATSAATAAARGCLLPSNRRTGLHPGRGALTHCIPIRGHACTAPAATTSGQRAREESGAHGTCPSPPNEQDQYQSAEKNQGGHQSTHVATSRLSLPPTPPPIP